VRTRNDLTLDYSNPQIVKDNLEVLTQEKFKGKYSAPFHVQVLTRMADMMPESDELSVLRLKVNVLVYLIATYSQTVKTCGVLGREEWTQVLQRIQQLLATVQKPAFKKSLIQAHTA
jgi:hypothetical protein